MVKDDQAFSAQVLSRLPLAEAVLTTLRFVLEPEALDDLYERERGRCYERALSFDRMVELLSDCLLGPAQSGRESLLQTAQDGDLSVTPRAFYDKLSRWPVDLSAAFLAECTDRLRQALPRQFGELPKSLAEFSVTLIDGKVIKHVPRRLLPLRLDQRNAHKLLGGRALVAMDLRSGLVLAWHGHPDGECNDVRFVPELLARLPGRVQQPLFVGDRALGTVEQALRFCQQGEFLTRLHGQTPFEVDAETTARQGQDRWGRAYREEWGWICRGKPRPAKVRVRRITLERSDKPLVLITSLLDADRYPADDLLHCYLRRWQIEGMFQEITEVFQLRRLIGTTPEAMLFQLSFCLLVYNIVRVVKHYVAQAGECSVEEVSSDMLFRDVRRELTAACELIRPTQLLELLPPITTVPQWQSHLQRLLGNCWKAKWAKANYRPRQPTRVPKPKTKKLRQKKAHDSVYRVLQRKS